MVGDTRTDAGRRRHGPGCQEVEAHRSAAGCWRLIALMMVACRCRTTLFTKRDRCREKWPMPSVPICNAPGMVDLTQVQRDAPWNLALKFLTWLSIVCQGSMGHFASARPSIFRRPRASAACPRPKQKEWLIGSGVVCSTLTTILHKVIQRGCMCGLKQIRQYLCWEGSGMGDAGLTDLHEMQVQVNHVRSKVPSQNTA